MQLQLVAPASNAQFFNQRNMKTKSQPVNIISRSVCKTETRLSLSYGQNSLNVKFSVEKKMTQVTEQSKYGVKKMVQQPKKFVQKE